MSSTKKFDFSVGPFDFRLQVEADHHGGTKNTHTKLDFGVGSFDFRLQVKADHHGAIKHTQQTTRAKNSSTHRSRSRHTALTQRAAH